MHNAVEVWFGLRVDFLALFVQSSLTFIAVLTVNKDNAIILSMLLNNVFSLSYEIPTFLNDTMSV